MSAAQSGNQAPLPRVMVLIYQPELTHSVWQDYRHRCRTANGLQKLLKREKLSGRIVAHRLITIHEERFGL